MAASLPRSWDLIQVAALLAIDFGDPDQRGNCEPRRRDKRALQQVSGLRCYRLVWRFATQRLPKLRTINVHRGNALHLWKVQIGGRLAKADLKANINFPKDRGVMRFAEVLAARRAAACRAPGRPPRT